MSSDITSTVAEALQNSLFGRHGVGRGYAGLLGEWAHHAGTEASLTEKGSPTRVELGVCKLCSQFGHCSAFPKWLCVYAEGWGWEIVLVSSYVPEEVSL